MYPNPDSTGRHNVQLSLIFDIPSAYINDDARQFRYSNETTTDDHGLHLVGYLEKDGEGLVSYKRLGFGFTEQ